MDKKVNIGVDIGGSHIAIGAVTNDGEIIDAFDKYFTKEEKENLAEITVNFIVQNVEILKEKYLIKKIGIGVAGTVCNGVIVKSVNLDIKNFDIKNILEKKLNIEVTVKNDAKCASIAEYKFGKCKQYKNVLFLTLGTGIGGSYIYEGKLLEGAIYDGLEFGHIVIEKNGIKCRCGKEGCFEKYASLAALKNKIIDVEHLEYDTPGEEIRKIMETENNNIKEIKDAYVNNLAIGLSNLVNIFEPDCVVIGGGFAKYSYLLMDELKEKLLKSKLLFNTREDITIIPAELKNDAGIIGASLL